MTEMGLGVHRWCYCRHVSYILCICGEVEMVAKVLEEGKIVSVSSVEEFSSPDPTGGRNRLDAYSIGVYIKLMRQLVCVSSDV